MGGQASLAAAQPGRRAGARARTSGPPGGGPPKGRRPRLPVRVIDLSTGWSRSMWPRCETRLRQPAGGSWWQAPLSTGAASALPCWRR